MFLIAHRGNLYGSNHNDENKLEYVQKALDLGFHVEIDLWYFPNENSLYLGHDEPQYICDYDFLTKDRLWIHCKNIYALEYCKDNAIQNPYFWHNEDDTTLTSTGHFWTFPGKTLTKYSIAVMPEYEAFTNLAICQGICSDFVGNGKEYFLNTLK